MVPRSAYSIRADGPLAARPSWTQLPFVSPRDVISDQRARFMPEEEDDEEYGGANNSPAPMADDEALPQSPPETFEPVQLKSRRRETERLGDPGDRANCFGCVYFGEKDTTIPSDELVHLIEMSRQSIGRIDLISLAEGMADYYERKVRTRINANLQPGERPLPYWPASQILDHIRHHNQDPQVQQVVLLAETQEIRTESLDLCFERSNKTGKLRINKTAYDTYEKSVKLQLHIQKQDASKMAFYSAGARVNPEILNQGILSTHTKKLHAYWGKK